MYRIIPDAAVSEQVAALPDDALAAYADLLGVLARTPWDGSPLHEDNVDGEVRRWGFGPSMAGQVIYIVIERTREVHIVLVQWFG